MIHTCAIHCHSIDVSQVDILGLAKDKGKWLPFAFHMSIVVGCKMTTDDEDEIVNNCTTIFTDSGETYIIDTPYYQFLALFKKFNQESEEPKSDLNF
jgi:hypothetical protein